MLPAAASGIITLFLASAAFLLTLARRRRAPVAAGGHGTPGLDIQVTNHAVARRALVQHSTALLDRPTGAIVSNVLTCNRHCNIASAPYGPYWRATRRNMVTGVFHPSHLRMLHETRARVLAGLVRALKSGAPILESLHFAMFCIIAEMCFGEDVVSKLGEARLRAMEKFHGDIVNAFPSFGVFVRYPRAGRFLYPSRWRQLLAFRRQQEETYLPLVAEVRKQQKASGHGNCSITSYVESLLDLRIHGDGDRALTDGEIVSLLSEFLGAETDSTAIMLEWALANLVKYPELQQKLRREVDACGERVIEEADLSRMPYLKAVVLESFRRHPPQTAITRHAEGEDAATALGVAGLPDGGATVSFLIGSIGQDPAAWSDPMSFSPERFLPGGEAEAVVMRELKMIPFGAGRRVCPALGASMLHFEYFLANLVREFEWSKVDGDEVDLTEIINGSLIFMRRPLRARLVPRDAAAERLAK